MLAPRRLALLAAFACTAPAQEISLTLQTLKGQTQFRVGEVIPVELSFQSKIPNRFLVWTVPTREIMGEEYDRFLIEPAEGTIIFRTRGQNAYNGPGHEPDPLGITPISTTLTANDWIAIREPGHDRISVETRRALTWLPGGRRGEPVTLRSNTIEIDAVTPEPGWAEALIKRASDVISGASPNRFPLDDNEAARALRFLGTREAADALVRFHLNGSPGVQYEIVKGLMESPYRREIIDELEAAMADPGAQISQPRQVSTTLTMLKAR